MSGSINQLIAQGGVQQNQNPLAMAGNVLDFARGAQSLKTQQFQLQQAQLGPAYQAMRQVMATNPNPTWDDVNAALAQSARIGGNVGGLVANAAETASKGGNAGDFVRATALGGMSPWEQGQLAGPQRAQFDTGAGTVYGTTGGLWSRQAGQFQPGGFVAQGLSPGQATEFVTVQGPDGKPYQVPRGTLFGTGVPGGGGGPAAGGAAPSAGGPGGGAVALGMRQNNPGNLMFAGQPGAAPGQGNRFASFPDMPTGVAANVAQLIANQDNHGINTVAGQVNRWVSDPNANLSSYVADISNALGVKPTDPVNFHDPAVLQKYIMAMQPHESGGGGAVLSPNDVSAGVQMALSGSQGSGGSRFPPGSYQVASNAPVAPPTGSGGGGSNVQPAGDMQYFSPTGQPMGQGGSGMQIPGVARTPSGAPVLTPPAPWMGPLWEQSAKEYSTDVSREAGLASRIQPYQSAISIINAHPDLKTGPTSQQWNNWGSTLSQWGVQLPSQPGDSTAAYQELSKALHQGLTNSGAFSGTDMARLEAEASSPNIQQNTEAIRELSARQIGYERFQMARLKQFRSLHPGEDPDQSANQYRSQTSQWASNLDPVAFGADNLTPQEITTYRKGLTPQQDDKFLRSIKEAHRLYPEITPGGQ